jgi:DNA replication protein DnaC
MEVAEMINDETQRKLRELNLAEVITVLEMQQGDAGYVTLSFDERFQRVTDYLYQEKYNAKIQRLIQLSKFRLPKAEMNDVYYAGRGLNRDALQELSTSQFVHSMTNVIFQGFTGSGKTFMACALGKQACKQRVRTRYVRLPDLLEEHDEATLTKKSNYQLLKRYSGYGLLILDEWLLEDISEDEQHFLFELIERRHDSAPTIFCTQYRQEDWHTRLGGGVHADAIMDRIVHNAVWIETGTMNMREYYSKHRL